MGHHRGQAEAYLEQHCKTTILQKKKKLKEKMILIFKQGQEVFLPRGSKPHMVSILPPASLGKRCVC